MLKYLLPALVLAVTPVAAQAQDVRGGISVTIGEPAPYHYNPRPYNYGYQYGRQYGVGYHGPIFLDQWGVYRCIKPYSRFLGTLTDRYGRPITRYNFGYTYYQHGPMRLRCR